MTRVVRPGRRLVVCDPDAGMTAIDADDAQTTSAMLEFRASERASGFLGRHAAAMFSYAGLEGVRVSGTVSVFRRLVAVEQTMGLQDAVKRASAEGVVAVDDANAWIADLERRDREGRFLVALVLLTTVGTKPGRSARRRSPRLRAARTGWDRIRFRLVQARWMARQRARRAR
jgi:hypothetical protein